MKAGDRVKITSVTNNESRYFQVGDLATLTHHDGSYWHADFDDHDWGEHGFDPSNKNFCIQKGFATCEVITEGPTNAK